MLGGCSERVSAVKFPDLRENTGNSVRIRRREVANSSLHKGLPVDFPNELNREMLSENRELSFGNRDHPRRLMNVCNQSNNGHAKHLADVRF